MKSDIFLAICLILSFAFAFLFVGFVHDKFNVTIQQISDVRQDISVNYETSKLKQQEIATIIDTLQKEHDITKTQLEDIKKQNDDLTDKISTLTELLKKKK